MARAVRCLRTHVRLYTKTFDPATSSPGMACWIGKIMEAEDPSLPLTTLGLCSTDLRSSPLHASVPAGKTKTYSVMAVLYTSLDQIYYPGKTPVALAAQDFKAADGMPAESRWATHVTGVDAALASGIEVTGNHDLAKLVNASLHMLVVSVTYRAGSDVRQSLEMLSHRV